MSRYETGNSRVTPAGLRPDTDVPKWVWIAPCIALLAALLPLPYGYYMGMRWLVAACAAFLAWKEYDGSGREPNSFVWILGAVALLYNPIIPIHLFQIAWIALNLVAAAVFLGHYKLCLGGVGQE